MICVREILTAASVCVALAGCATRGADLANTAPSAELASLDDLEGQAPVASSDAIAQLTLDTPVGKICDDPQGRVVLDRNLPNLRKNPNYFLFKGMSLRQLAGMSGGKITTATLEQVRLDLASMPALGH